MNLSLFLLENSFPDIMSLYFSFNVVYEQICNYSTGNMLIILIKMELFSKHFTIFMSIKQLGTSQADRQFIHQIVCIFIYKVIFYFKNSYLITKLFSPLGLKFFYLVQKHVARTKMYQFSKQIIKHCKIFTSCFFKWESVQPSIS